MIEMTCALCHTGRHASGGFQDGPWWNSFTDLGEYQIHMATYHNVRVTFTFVNTEAE